MHEKAAEGEARLQETASARATSLAHQPLAAVQKKAWPLVPPEHGATTTPDPCVSFRITNALPHCVQQSEMLLRSFKRLLRLLLPAY